MNHLNIKRYYHGTKANLKSGDYIKPGFASNFGKRKISKYVYFSETLDAAIWGAELALGTGPERIYEIQPTGPFEDDPNLTDKKFPGNPTKSYRTAYCLWIIGEIKEWDSHSPEALETMRSHISKLSDTDADPIE